MDAFAAKGFYTIGALKTNRCIYPHGAKLNVHNFAEKLKEAGHRKFFHPVTVKGRTYLVHRYEGRLNDINENVFLIVSKIDVMNPTIAFQTAEIFSAIQSIALPIRI